MGGRYDRNHRLGVGGPEVPEFDGSVLRPREQLVRRLLSRGVGRHDEVEGIDATLVVDEPVQEFGLTVGGHAVDGNGTVGETTGDGVAVGLDGVDVDELVGLDACRGIGRARQVDDGELVGDGGLVTVQRKHFQVVFASDNDVVGWGRGVVVGGCGEREVQLRQARYLSVAAVDQFVGGQAGDGARARRCGGPSGRVAGRVVLAQRPVDVKGELGQAQVIDGHGWAIC